MQLWRVVSLHSQKYFKLSVESSEMNKGYCLLALAHHLALEIHPSEEDISLMFQTDRFINRLKFIPLVKTANLVPSFLLELLSEVEVQANSQLFMQMVT